MTPASRSPFFAQAIVCWNWKCALMSATARSLVYLAAMARTGLQSGLPVVLVEMVYVTLTAGLYAGLQQRALGFRSRLLGNLTVVLAVPMLAQILDWLAGGCSRKGHLGCLRLRHNLGALPSARYAPRRLPHRPRQPLACG